MDTSGFLVSVLDKRLLGTVYFGFILWMIIEKILENEKVTDIDALWKSPDKLKKGVFIIGCIFAVLAAVKMFPSLLIIWTVIPLGIVAAESFYELVLYYRYNVSSFLPVNEDIRITKRAILEKYPSSVKYIAFVEELAETEDNQSEN